MPENKKIHRVKALMLPILDYPPIPMHTMSKTQISKLQKVQNRALRFATSQTPLHNDHNTNTCTRQYNTTEYKIMQ